MLMICLMGYMETQSKMKISGKITGISYGKENNGGEYSVVSVEVGDKVKMSDSIRVKGRMFEEFIGSSFVYRETPFRDPEDILVNNGNGNGKGKGALYEMVMDRWVADINRYCGWRN